MEDCIFCKIIAGTIPSTKALENDHVVVIKDINPAAITHLLIMPKKHIENLLTVEPADKEILGEILFAANTLANDLQIGEKGFKLRVSNGENAGQEVGHLHFHFLTDKQTKFS